MVVLLALALTSCACLQPAALLPLRPHPRRRHGDHRLGRIDVFFGSGATAEAIAGDLRNPGELYILVPTPQQ